MRIPKEPQDLTPQWLTGALRQAGALDQANVLSLQASEIGQDAGITARILRLEIEYDLQELDAPRTLIAKLSKGGNERELWFYRELAEQVTLPTPRCHLADAVDGGPAVLLLEDLAPARSDNTITSDDLPLVKQAVQHHARLHAAWWEDPRLDTMEQLWRIDGEQAVELMAPRWDTFRAYARNRIPNEEMIRRIERLCAPVFDRLYVEAPRTLIHNDSQADNIFFGTPGCSAPLTFIDFQLLAHGRGAHDIAYLLCLGGAHPPLRREIEMDLLETYHRTLLAHGVRGYTFAQCVHDYGISAIAILIRLIYVVGGRVSPQHDDRFLDLLIPRAYAAVCDLKALDLLPG